MEHLLKTAAKQTDIEALAKAARAFAPFPKASDRAGWLALSNETRERLIKRAEDYKDFAWPELPATRYMDFFRNGNRTHFQNPYFKRRQALFTLVLAECAQGEGLFMDDIINGIWHICEESAWWLPAHMTLLPEQNHALPRIDAPVLDLFAAETAAILAFTSYLLGDELDAACPVICERIHHEVKIRAIDPYLYNDFFWMGTRKGSRSGNWTTWCTSNMLGVLLLMEDDSKRRKIGLEKAIFSSDRFIDSYPDDVGCEEGPRYWSAAGGALFECLELLYRASEGSINIFNEPKIREIGSCIHKLHIAGDYYLNYGDSDARVSISPWLLYMYGLRTGDEDLIKHGISQTKPGMAHKEQRRPFRTLCELFGDQDMRSRDENPPQKRDLFIKSLQTMVARESEGTSDGFYLGVKGGHNGNYHNHNDAGVFTVFYNGCPVFIDVGVGAYTASHSSAGTERYKIWTQCSSYHNLPIVNGVEQRVGNEFGIASVQYNASDSVSEIAFDLAGAYPDDAGIVSWIRACRLLRGYGARVEIDESFSLNFAKGISFVFMTPICPKLSEGAATLELNGDTVVTLNFDASLLDVKYEFVETDDEQLRPYWGAGVYRIIATTRSPQKEGRVLFTVIRE